MEGLLEKIHITENETDFDKLNNNNSSNSQPHVIHDLLKRSQTLLSLNLYQKSLKCSEMILNALIPEPDNINTTKLLDSDSELLNLRLKCVDLKGKALLGLGQWEDSIHFLSKETKVLKNLGLKLSPPQSQSPVHKRHIQHWKYLMERAKVLQRASITGDIDMGAFVPNKKVRLDVDCVVEFQDTRIEIGAVIQGKGRGVKVVVDDIPKGTLILATRAFEIIFDTEDEDDDLENAIAQRMRLDPELIPAVYQLHAGKDMGYFCPNNNNNTISENNVVDLKRIAGICTMNSFGNSRNSNGYGHNSRGLWVRASFFNHDCIDFNCMWKVLGNFLFVRTVQDVKKGDELLIAYTDTAESFDEREKFFQAHDFSCACRLCKYQSQENVKTRQRRLEILQQLSVLDEKDRKTITPTELEKDILFAEKCLQELESMGQAEDSRPEWNFSIHVALDLLTKLYLKKDDPVKYKETACRYYIVVNCSGMSQKDQENLLTNKEPSIKDVQDKGPCLEVGAAGQVTAVFLKAQDFIGAQKWIKILRQDLALVYGKGNKELLKKLYPQLHFQAVKQGLCID